MPPSPHSSHFVLERRMDLEICGSGGANFLGSLPKTLQNNLYVNTRIMNSDLKWDRPAFAWHLSVAV